MSEHHELPPDKHEKLLEAVRLEWLSIGYLLSAIVLLYFTLGSSQAMKAAWVEDILGLTPPIAFLVASRVRNRKPNDRFPYGYHRATSIAYLCASVALLALGAFILYDSVSKLIKFEHPPIDLVKPFGDRPIWLGWLMLAALAYSAVPQVILGRLKQPLARELNDKVLYADAEMNRADWMTGGAAMLGVVGIGLGLWWADSVAASIISLDIVRDGYTNLQVAVDDLMDKEPTVVGDSRADPLPLWIKNQLMIMDWVKDAEVRLREAGHVFTGEAFVVPVDDQDLVGRIERANQQLLDLDWRLHELVIAPVREIQRPESAGENS
ncbi:MAG TPA: cation diffusion facilitator family transporter [Actinomycetes bacterium]|jgi:cation diffusion facilitator family transporter|nr:cation diffusion facilitator family transporter [Actinomycetes bacterium]